MGIRKSILRPKVLGYHIKYGSVEKPPLEINGPYSWWPNGSLVTSKIKISGQPRDLVIGWVCQQTSISRRAVWVCTKPAVLIASPSLKYRALPVGDAVPGTYKFVMNFPETVQFTKCLSTLFAAYDNLHDTSLG